MQDLSYFISNTSIITLQNIVHEGLIYDFWFNLSDFGNESYT